MCKIFLHQRDCQFNPNCRKDHDDRVIVLYTCNICERAFTHLFDHKYHFNKNKCGTYEKPKILYHCVRCKKRFTRKSATIEHYLKVNGCKENSNYPDGTYFIEEGPKIESRESSISSNSLKTMRAEALSATPLIPVDDDDTFIVLEKINDAELPKPNENEMENTNDIHELTIDAAPKKIKTLEGIICEQAQEIVRLRAHIDILTTNNNKLEQQLASCATSASDQTIGQTTAFVTPTEPDIIFDKQSIPIIDATQKSGWQTRKRSTGMKTYYRKHAACFIQTTSCAKIENKCLNCVTEKYDECRLKGVRLITRNKYGTMITGGFLNPMEDPAETDINIWSSEMLQPKLDLNMARYILTHLFKHFAYICEQENEVYANYVEKVNNQIIWKPFAVHMREICDNCDITIFNYHWFCKNCGYSLCIDCNRDLNKTCGSCDKRCKPKLTLAQIIPKKMLQLLKEDVMRVMSSETMHTLTNNILSPGPCAPHTRSCENRILCLTSTLDRNNIEMFRNEWLKKKPVIFCNVDSNLDMALWRPDKVIENIGHLELNLVDWVYEKCTSKMKLTHFFSWFIEGESNTKRKQGGTLKLNNWPPHENFVDVLPEHFHDFTRSLPLSEYTHDGSLNLVNHLPNCFLKPDLGPKMFAADGNVIHLQKGTTNLHLDAADAVNVLVYANVPKDIDEMRKRKVYEALDDAGCDQLAEGDTLPGALWHIYSPGDADKIRSLLIKRASELGVRINCDPIHDQSWYLDKALRRRLYDEYCVQGYAIAQCVGNAIYIPAGAAHQVRNIFDCIKVAEDIVTPENVSTCIDITREFCALPKKHAQHEDKLQIKHIIFHAVKNAASVIQHNK